MQITAAMAKRFKSFFADWTCMEKLVSIEQRAKYLAFRSRYERYLQRVRSIPEEPPQIDWEGYKELMPDSIVSRMQSSYEAFQVPFPQDPQTRLVEEQWKLMEPAVKAFCDDIQKDIDKAQKELARIKTLPDFRDMTMEMFRDSYPDLALDSINRPTFWPHTPEDQPGHQITEAELSKHDDK